MRKKTRLDLLQGTLEMLILQTLAERPTHGYAIARHIERVADGLRVEEGSLYPALHRMERRGWLEAEWGRTESNRRVRVYTLTPAGRKQLRAEVDRWFRFCGAVSRLVQPA